MAELVLPPSDPSIHQKIDQVKCVRTTAQCSCVLSQYCSVLIQDSSLLSNVRDHEIDVLEQGRFGRLDSGSSQISTNPFYGNSLSERLGEAPPQPPSAVLTLDRRQNSSASDMVLTKCTRPALWIHRASNISPSTSFSHLYVYHISILPLIDVDSLCS